MKDISVSMNYTNLKSFMKRHGLTIGDLATTVGKSYPPIHQKINMKTSKQGKVALFDIEEAKSIIVFIIKTEQDYLKTRFGDDWQKEWNVRWGHITNWFDYIFFDQMVTIETKAG